MADVTQRMLALLSTLQSGRSFTGAELADRLGISARTVRRDVDRLRAYGYPVDARPGPGGRYRLAAGRSLPPLLLDDGEAVATVLGLALLAATTSGDDEAVDSAAIRAYGKLDQLLPARLRPQVVALRTSVEARRHSTPAVATSVLAELAAAIAGGEVVRFDYRDQHGARTERRVEPRRQVHLRLRWYLLAWDLERGDWRVFRLDRVTALRRTTARATPRPLPADTAVEYLLSGMNADRERVRLTVAAPAEAVADVLKDHDPEIAPAGEAGTDVTVWVDTWEWLLPQLARLDSDVTVVEPTAIRAALRTFARRLLAATDVDDSTGGT